MIMYTLTTMYMFQQKQDTYYLLFTYTDLKLLRRRGTKKLGVTIASVLKSIAPLSMNLQTL